MIILETRSEVKVNKVTETPKWYVTLCNPKMYLHTKFGIPTSNNVGYGLHRIIFEWGQGHSNPKMVHHTLSSQEASTHKFWDSVILRSIHTQILGFLSQIYSEKQLKDIKILLTL